MKRSMEQYGWYAFLAWYGAGFIFMLAKINVGTVAQLKLPLFLQIFVEQCFFWGDLVLMLLATCCVWRLNQKIMSQNRQWIWFFSCVFIGGGMEWIGATTGWPFGNYRYTENMGPVILGILPIAIPLAWYVVTSCVAILVMPFFGKEKYAWPSAWIAIYAAILATMYDVLMEPYAIHVKRYWIWNESVASPIPATNFVAWFVITFLIVFFTFRCEKEMTPQKNREAFVGAITIIGLFLILFLVGQKWMAV
jgi:uncharacterized membrane protein